MKARFDVVFSSSSVIMKKMEDLFVNEEQLKNKISCTNCELIALFTKR